MNLRIIACAALVAAAALGGCHKKNDKAEDTGVFGWSPGGHGRYLGVGIYSPQDAWTKLADVQQPNGKPKTAADQAIIVSVDSATGEMRACGDLSGYCVGMNPWNKALTGAQKAPVVLGASAKSDETEPAPAVETQAAKSKTHR
jgi:hypothetical protein